jgi:hypothetical protein
MDATPKSPLEPELLAGEPHKKLAKVPELQLREAEPPQREPEPASLVAIMIGAQDLDELASNRSATAVANQSVEGHALRKRRLGRLESVDLGTSQPSLIQDVPAMPEVFGTSRPLPNVLWGGGRAANFLQVLVLTIQDRASIFVKLPALWDMARHQIRDLVAGRASALGVPVERIEIAGQRPANSQTSLRLEEYRP